MNKPEKYDAIVEELREAIFPQMAKLAADLRANADEAQCVDLKLGPDYVDALLFLIADLEERNYRALELLKKLEPALIQARHTRDEVEVFLVNVASSPHGPPPAAWSNIQRECVRILKLMKGK